MAIVRVTLKEMQNYQPSARELAQLKALKDEDIDFTDMPKLTQEFWDKAMTPAQFKRYRRQLKNSKHSEVA